MEPLFLSGMHASQEAAELRIAGVIREADIVNLLGEADIARLARKVVEDIQCKRLCPGSVCPGCRKTCSMQTGRAVSARVVDLQGLLRIWDLVTNVF